MDTTLHIKALDLDESALDSLQGSAVDEDARWYYERRRRALVAIGVLAAGKWDPLQHPRGRDGRFIDKYGFVRWLVDGKWVRGQVEDIAANGDIRVRGQDGDPHIFSNTTARKELYHLPKPKASVKLPNPKSDLSAPGFVKIGGQGGSNPGALYSVNTESYGLPEGNMAHSATTARDALSYVREQDWGGGYKSTPMDFDINETVQTVRNQFEQNGFILDKNRNRVYSVTDGKIKRLDTGETVTADELFGLPGTDDRLGAIGQFDMIDRLDIEDAIRFEVQMRSILQHLPTNGDQFYVKTAKSEDHAKNEKLANWLYEMGGVPVPDVAIGDDGVTISSKMITPGSAETLTLKDSLLDPEIASRIREDMVFDAWLANWDVAGLEYDNMITVEGVPFRVDAGGALSYRAQGSSKGNKFGPTVGELDSLRSSSMNPQAAKVFGPITDAELKAGGQRLAAISATDIRRAVAEAGLDDDMADTLIARRAYILDKLAIDEPAHTFSPPQAWLDEKPITVKNSDGLDMDIASDGTLTYSAPFPYPLNLSGKVWHPGTKNFVDGLTYEKWSDEFKYFGDLNPAMQVSVEQIAKGDQEYYAMHDDGHLYKVTAEYKDGGSGAQDSYELTWEHAANFRQIAGVKMHPGGTLMVMVHPEISMPNFNSVWSNKRLLAIDKNSRRSEASLMIDAVNSWGDMATTPFADFKSVEVGDWVLDTGAKKFYRFDGFDPNNSLRALVSDLDGNTVKVELPLSPLRWRRPTTGSFLSETLDASRARNDVSKKNEPDLASLLTTDGDKQLQAAVADTPNVDTGAVIKEPTPDGYFDVMEDGLNPSVQIGGEPKIIKNMTFEEAKPLIGQNVYLQLGFQPSQKYGYTPPRPRGVFKVVNVVQQGDSNVSITVADSVGNTRMFGKWGEQMELVPVASAIAPITQFQAKKDGTLVANGEVVGTWKKMYNGYLVSIAPEYSVTGHTFIQRVNQKNGIKQVAIPMIVPPGSAKARPKSDKSKQLEKKIREADVKFSEPNQTTAGGHAVTLLDGAEINDGMWVISKTDGQVGQVDGVSTSYLGYVNVKTPDGKVKIRAAKTLSAASDPTGEIMPPPSPLYADVKLSDGSQAYPSQKVLDGSSELVLIQLKPDGSVRVGHPDGKKTWMKASKLAPAKPEVTEPEDDAEIIATADESWKIAPKPGKIPYAAPGGATISQTSNAVEIWREFAITRKLTKDNFVPTVGMKVRGTNGKQGTIVRIAPTTSANPSAVWVYDHDSGKISVKQPSVLWVDHAAELSTSDGKPLPVVGGLYFEKADKSESLPAGTVIYSADFTYYAGGRNVNGKQYYAALPNGRVVYVRNSSASEQVWKSDISDAVTKNWTKVAVVVEGSTNVMTVEGSPSTSLITAVYVHPDAPGELEKLKGEVAEKQIQAGVVTEEIFAGSSKQLIRLPKPSTAKEAHSSALKPPVASGDGTALQGPAAVEGALSIDTGLKRLLEQRDKNEPGQSVVYAIGDSDYIEDMAIRMHTAVDKTTGEEMLEIRFGLLEEHADALASHLIVNDGKVVGNWKQSDTKAVTSLTDGDAISVRISGTTGALRPGFDNYPNARVVGTPTHIGVSKSGLEAYRVDVAMASGGVGHIIVELRPTPSIKTFEWDPNAAVVSSSFNGSMNGDATAMGWSTRNDNAVGYEANGKIEVDEKGRKIVNKENQGLKSIASYSGAARLQYDHPNGGFMSVQVVHPDAESRRQPVDQNSAIRSSVNGEVVIRVAADDPDALQKISDMMAAAGVPPEKQVQPTADDLTKMALNKIHKQYSSKYEHMDQANVNGSNDEPGVAAVLAEVDKAIGSTLGRKVTLDDVRLRVMPDGRVSVVVSDAVADAVVARAGGFTHAYHSFTGSGYKPEIFSSRASTGLLSTDERWSLGILTSGMSSGSDVTNDAGNRVYLRLSTKKGGIGNSGQALVSSRAVAKTTDWYWHTGDRWGKRQSNNLAWTTFTGGGDQELMMKRKLDPDIIGFVTFGSESARVQAIADLHAQGVEKIGDRMVEDVFIVAGTKNAADIWNVGVDVGTEIPLTALVVPA